MEGKEEQLNNSTAKTMLADVKYHKEIEDHLQEEPSVHLPVNKGMGTANLVVSNRSA